MQKQDVDRHIQRVHEKVKQVGGKLRYMCKQCPSGYSNVRMFDQHVKGVHAPAEQEDQGHVKNEDDNGSGLIDELGDTEELPSSSEVEDDEQNLDESATEIMVDNKDSLGNDRTETEKSDKIRNKEEMAKIEVTNSEQPEEEVEKETNAKLDLLKGLRKKYEYLCKRVGSEEAERIFQKVTLQCKNAANKPN